MIRKTRSRIIENCPVKSFGNLQLLYPTKNWCLKVRAISDENDKNQATRPWLVVRALPLSKRRENACGRVNCFRNT